MVCFVLHTACRLAMAVTTSRHVLLAVLLGPETMAGALGVPVLTIGIKRFTNQARDSSPAWHACCDHGCYCYPASCSGNGQAWIVVFSGSYLSSSCLVQ